MNRFLGTTARELTPYTPGEQPRDKQYVKLNTNECPYPPSPGVTEAIRAQDAADLRLYPDPEATVLREALARLHRVGPEQVFVGNGSDEVLAFSFFAFFDRRDTVCFPDVTYSFYPVYARLCGLETHIIPVEEDFRLPLERFRSLPGHLYLANPNAPTGLALKRGEVEELLRDNPDRLVVVDEAYADFAREPVSAAPLVDRYDNLLVVRTFSKSYSLAGLRVGYAVGCRSLIDGLERIKNSINSYTVNRLSLAAATAAVEDVVYWREMVDRVASTRERATAALRQRGFQLADSDANFVFAKKPGTDGRALYQALRDRGVLVRHFAGDRTGDYLRITIGTDQEMDRLLTVLDEIAQ